MRTEGGSVVQRAFGLEIPRTLEEIVDPRRLALLVYDMQVGIFEQAPGLRPVIPRVVEVLACAREAGVRTFFCRHMSLPTALMGVSQVRTAMAWQRLDQVEDVRSHFLPDSAGFPLIPEMALRPSEAVFDKLGMSAFAGTPLDMVLRDCGVVAVAVVGVVLESGSPPRSATRRTWATSRSSSRTPAARWRRRPGGAPWPPSTTR